jgi:AraC family transcriptional activator of pobA
MSKIPNYALYGTDPKPPWEDFVFFERIPERSGLHNFQIQPHMHDGMLHLLYVRRGGGDTFVDDVRWPLRQDSLVIVPSQCVHGFRFTDDIDGPVVTAAQRPIESLAAISAPYLLDSIRQPAVVDTSLSPRHAEALMPLFEAIGQESRLQAADQMACSAALMLALFIQIHRIRQASQHAGSPGGTLSRRSLQIEKFRALVDAHFRERPAISWYAAELGLSAGQLSRLCRESLGMSSLDVINAHAAHAAERELIYSTLTVKQIASNLGFADEAYFGRFFRKQTNRSPTEFRQMARERLAETAQEGVVE